MGTSDAPDEPEKKSDDDEKPVKRKVPGPASDEKDADDEQYDEALRQLRQMPAATVTDAAFESERLRHYRVLEEASWEASSEKVGLRNLAWLLRSKREEARLRSIREAKDARHSSQCASAVAFAAVLVTILGWGLAWLKVFQAADVKWEPIVATSGTVLLLLGAATLQFRVARDHNQRSRRYAEDVEQTRRIEVAARLALACDGTTNAEVQKALVAVAVQLAAPPQSASDSVSEPFSATPDIVGEIIGAVVAVAKRHKQ